MRNARVVAELHSPERSRKIFLKRFESARVSLPVFVGRDSRGSVENDSSRNLEHDLSTVWWSIAHSKK